MRLLPMFLSALALPAALGPASAGATTTLPAMPVAGDVAADCVRDLGDGHLQLVRGDGRRPGARVELLALSSGGPPRRAASFALGGTLLDCPSASAAPGVAPLLGATVLTGRRIAQAVGSPGAAPVALVRESLFESLLSATVVANGPGGTAAVAWLAERRDGRKALTVARRAAAGTRFERPRVLEPDADFRERDAAAIAIDGEGRTTIAWQAGSADGDFPLLRVAQAKRGAPFGAPQTLGRSNFERPSLTVGPDGRALLAAIGTDRRLALWEAPSGGGPFVRIAAPRLAGKWAVGAIGADGGAVAAVFGDRGIAVVRPTSADAPFGGVQTVDHPHVRRTRDGRGVMPVSSNPGRFDDPGEYLQFGVRLAPSGRFAVAWFYPALGARPAQADSVAGTLAAGIEERTRLGSPCRTATSATPAVLADGTLVTTWSDAATATSDWESESDLADGRVGVVVPGGAEEAPSIALPQPAVRVSLAGSRTLRPGDPLRLRVRCTGGPCDVRASAWARTLGRASRGRRPPLLPAGASAASTTLADGARAVLTLRAPTARGVFAAPGRAGRPRIALTVCRAGEPAARRTTFAPRLRIAR
jgi:hypothetical protein